MPQDWSACPYTTQTLSRTLVLQETHGNTPFVLPQHTAQAPGDSWTQTFVNHWVSAEVEGGMGVSEHQMGGGIGKAFGGGGGIGGQP